MPTGRKPQKFSDTGDEPGFYYGEDCRCTIGEDHNCGDDTALSNYLSGSDAEDIWLSNGKDEAMTSARYRFRRPVVHLLGGLCDIERSQNAATKRSHPQR